MGKGGSPSRPAILRKASAGESWGNPGRILVNLSNSLANAHTRSEERRVGKECRYWRDWSSDVCSSDLTIKAGNSSKGLGRRELGKSGTYTGQLIKLIGKRAHQIGRASCRERV